MTWESSNHIQLARFMKKVALKSNTTIADAVATVISQINLDEDNMDQYYLEFDEEELHKFYSLLWAFLYKIQKFPDVQEYLATQIYFKKVAHRLNMSESFNKVKDEELQPMKEEHYRFLESSVPDLLKNLPPSGNYHELNNKKHPERESKYFVKINETSNTIHILDAGGATTLTNSIELVQDEICVRYGVHVDQWRWVYYSPDGIATEFDRKDTEFNCATNGMSFDVDLEYYEKMREIHKLSQY